MLLGAQAHAGLSLDHAIARDRSLRGGSEFALLPPVSDGATLAVGGPSDDTPYLLVPTLRGRGGARVVYTALGEPGQATLRLGLNAYESAPPESVLEGTSLELPFGPGAVYASVETRHWGPGWVGSLILDSAAPPVPAVGWRKTSATPFEHPWLSWLGPWNADFFIGRLGGHLEPAHPMLIGMRMQVRPLPGLEIGASRAIQWGGKGRDDTLRSFVKALIGRDNVDGNDRSAEPGNQLGGIDIRYGATWADAEWALYAQAVGEDEAGGLPSQLTAQIGTEWATRWQGTGVRLFAEASDLIAGDLFGRGGPRPGSTYRHHIYRQGYTNRGLPLGHPIGGDVKLASIGALADHGSFSMLVSAHHGRASATAQRFAPNVGLSGLNAAASFPVEGVGRVGLSLWLWRAGDDRSTALQAWWQTSWR